MTSLLALFQAQATTRLLSLRFVDALIILLYFLMILGIGFYLKRFTKTGMDFFLADRGITARETDLSFLASNLGSLELIGRAAFARQCRILATHFFPRKEGL